MSLVKRILQYDERLTLAAQEIFGAIVSKAYRTTWSYESSSKDVVARLAEVELTYDPKEVSYDNNNIVILFINGNSVCFKSSEWGTISSADDECFEELI